MLFTGLFLILAFFSVSFAQLSDYVAPYDCLKNTISQTMQIDADSNDEYDTYGFIYCGSEEVITFTLSAIGDISRWPPDGFPTRSIIFNDDGGNVSILETYFDDSGEILAWFQKSADNDTVFFHEGADDYDPVSFSYDSSASYIQAFPNPADQELKIHYVVASSNDNIEIQLLNYEGTYITSIVQAPHGEGEYMMVFPVSQLTSGYYRLRFISGSNNYFVNVAVVH
jgi:hypothetical protein